MIVWVVISYETERVTVPTAADDDILLLLSTRLAFIH